MCLFDGGSTSTWIKALSLPRGVNGRITNTVTSNTIAGNVKSNLVVDLNRIVLPEFRRSRTYRHIEGRILHADCRHDVIFGRNALSLFGYKPNFETHLMQIGDDIVPMRPLPSPPPSPEPTIAEALLLDSIDYELFDNDKSYPDFETKPRIPMMMLGLIHEMRTSLPQFTPIPMMQWTLHVSLMPVITLILPRRMT